MIFMPRRYQGLQGGGNLFVQQCSMICSTKRRAQVAMAIPALQIADIL
jgi:hypothetical protein